MDDMTRMAIEAIGKQFFPDKENCAIISKGLAQYVNKILVGRRNVDVAASFLAVVYEILSKCSTNEVLVTQMNLIKMLHDVANLPGVGDAAKEINRTIAMRRAMEGVIRGSA